jgi:hypothetical protein
LRRAGERRQSRGGHEKLAELAGLLVAVTVKGQPMRSRKNKN